MAKCARCGESLGFTTSNYCNSCKSDNETGSNSALAPTGEVPESASLIRNQAQNIFTNITYIIIVMTLIATGILTFMLASNNQPMLAAVTFMTGCFGAVLLGLLAEISANIIKLVNKPQ